jgi:hypothetical protein
VHRRAILWSFLQQRQVVKPLILQWSLKYKQQWAHILTMKMQPRCNIITGCLSIFTASDNKANTIRGWIWDNIKVENRDWCFGVKCTCRQMQGKCVSPVPSISYFITLKSTSSDKRHVHLFVCKKLKISSILSSNDKLCLIISKVFHYAAIKVFVAENFFFLVPLDDI